MNGSTVDLNADLGEGYGRWRLTEDEALLDVVTSANVACGFHAGDPSTMRRVCALAVERDVAIGAQVGYNDLSGFGRRFIDMDAEELRADVVYQVAALTGMAASVGGRVRYVKPHGALYNAVVHHHEQAEAVVRAVLDVDPGLPVLGLPGSVFLRRAAEAGLTVVTEAFADRAYRPDGTLVPRTEPGAVLHDVAEIVRRSVAMATGGEVPHHEPGEPAGTREAGGGAGPRRGPGTVTVRAGSVCVHGDTPGAVEIARAVRAGLAEAGVRVASFA